MCPSNAAKRGFKRVSFFQKSPRTASGCPFPSHSNKGFSPSNPSLLQPTCLCGRNSRVAASFFRCFRHVLKHREHCPDLPFFFLFARLSDWTISAHTERAVAFVDFTSTNVMKNPRQRCSAHCRALKGWLLQWINLLDQLRVPILPLKCAFLSLMCQGCLMLPVGSFIDS